MQFLGVKMDRQHKDTETSEDSSSEKLDNFLELLEKYRIKCEVEGNYLEAEKAAKQQKKLHAKKKDKEMKKKDEESKTQVEKIQNFQKVQVDELKETWKTFFKDFDELSKKHLKTLKQRHKEEIGVLKTNVKENERQKQTIFSKELLEWRRREILLAKCKNYTEAQKIKKIGDIVEFQENLRRKGKNDGALKKKLKGLKNRQDCQLFALKKKIKIRRAEHELKLKRNLEQLQSKQKNAILLLCKKQKAIQKIS